MPTQITQASDDLAEEEIPSVKYQHFLHLLRLFLMDAAEYCDQRIVDTMNHKFYKKISQKNYFIIKYAFY